MEYTDCRVCGGRVVLLEKRCDITGAVNALTICPGCFVIANASIVPADTVDEANRQRSASTGYYTVTEAEIPHIREELAATRGILSHFLPDMGGVDAEKTFLEIGSGRGLLLLAADALGFGTVIGVDLNTVGVTETLRHFPSQRPICMVTDLAAVDMGDTQADTQADVVFLWHTLEHLYEPHTMLDALTPRMRPHALFVAQVPQYHAPYIFATHYHFFNEPSLTALLIRHGLRIVRFEYDGARQYITVVAEYSGV